jgi:predicted transcriptional regulator
MTTAKERCDHLSRAIDRDDDEDIEAIAHQAVNLWLAGRAAFRKLSTALVVDAPYLRAAYRFMYEIYCLVLSLLNRASSRGVAVETDHAIRFLRASIMFGMNQGLSWEAASP